MVDSMLRRLSTSSVNVSIMSIFCIFLFSKNASRHAFLTLNTIFSQKKITDTFKTDKRGITAS